MGDSSGIILLGFLIVDSFGLFFFLDNLVSKNNKGMVIVILFDESILIVG